MNSRTILTIATAGALICGATLPLAANAQTPMRPIFRLGGATDATSTQARPGIYNGGMRATGTAVEARVEARMGATTTGERAQVREQRQNQILARAENRATQEIDRRVALLQRFEARIGNVKMSDTNKSALQATMQQEITNLTELKNQFASTTSTTTMRDAIQSIAKSYRVFALVMPQGAITAAADRVSNIVSQMTELSSKLSARVTSSNDASLSAVLTDFNAKIADAASQAKAAVTEVNALKPDNGDQTVFQANEAALKDARTKLQAAQQDLVAARKDAGDIVKALMANAPRATATTTATTTAQ